MKIERLPVVDFAPTTGTIEQFAEYHDLTMEVHERGKNRGELPRYYAHFENVDVKTGGCLASEYGSGETEAEAIADYARRISGKLLIVDALGPQRKEIRVWELSD